MSKADVYTFETAGSWNEESNWDIYPGSAIDAGDEVIITADITINVFVILNGSLEVNAGVLFTNDWGMNVNGSILIDGDVINNGQINLFGTATSNGTWENSEMGALIITNIGDYSCFGNFTNNGSLIGYESSQFYLESSFYNNDNFTFSGSLDINQTSGREFVNDGFIQVNGVIRLEGTLVNKMGVIFNINPTSTIIIANNGKIENLGIIKIQGLMEMSSLLNAHSLLGNIEVGGEMIVKQEIAEIL